MLKPCLVFPSLNPFENQVYFYKKDKDLKWGDMVLVLIPLRIRSISTDGVK